MMKNREVLKLVNTEAGRYLLGIKNTYPVVKLTPNSYHQVVDIKDDKVVIQAYFSTDQNRFSKIFSPLVEKLGLADEYKPISDLDEAFAHYAGLKLKNHRYPQIFLTTTNFTPGSGNGSVGIQAQVSWAAARGAASGAYIQNNPNPDTDSPLSAVSGGSYYNYRSFFPTDTSALTTSATIASAVFNGYITNINGATSVVNHLVQTSQAATSTLVATDYPAVTFTSGGSATITTGGAYTITLNATGLTWLSKTGFSMLGMIRDYDLNNSTPPDAQDPLQAFRLSANAPFIAITYTLPTSGGAFLQHFV